ncbi:MAG: Hemolysin-type calcium-binding region [Nitrospira sp.]|nr:MAG: Hemolysin-type calcium-binding region [Nitrospira sp.]
MTVELSDYALMAGASYISTRHDVNKFPIPSNWAVITNPDSYARDPNTGFEAISFQRGNEIVISFAGTNPNDGILPPGPDNTANIGLASGVGSVQLLQAAEYYLQVKAANPNATITFTGHSLGGGLAALMGVFFGKQAVIFDQAPFANSAELNLLTPNVAANLKADLLAHGYSEAALQGLTDFLSIRAALPLGEIPNASLVTSINVQGEFLSGVPWNLPDRIGLIRTKHVCAEDLFTSTFDLERSAA